MQVDVEDLRAHQPPPQQRRIVIRVGFVGVMVEQLIVAAEQGLAAERSVAAARTAIGTQLTILSPDDEEAMLAEAGFTGTTLFYAGLSFRGWVAYG